MRRVLMVGFAGVQTLDLVGPAEVFSMASGHTRRAAYGVVFAARAARSIVSTSGCSIATRQLARLRVSRRDTVLVAGGDEAAISAAVRDEALLAWLRRASHTAGRIGSVCSGAFVLAAAGLLDGRRAATHWSSCDRLARFRPQLTVDRDAIFVRDGRVWTSAGVTTGIDMALAMVEEDHGTHVADAIAARLVLYVRRPGFQSQFSAALVAQGDASDPLGRALASAREHLRDLDVSRLARHAGLSVRTLHRHCREHLGTTPAKLVERLRVEHARALLATTSLSAKTLAAQCGFGSPARMNAAFRRTLGIAPRDARLLSRRPAQA